MRAHGPSDSGKESTLNPNPPNRKLKRRERRDPAPRDRVPSRHHRSLDPLSEGSSKVTVGVWCVGLREFLFSDLPWGSVGLEGIL